MIIKGQERIFYNDKNILNFYWVAGYTSVCLFDETHWIVCSNWVCFTVYNVYAHLYGFPILTLWKESLHKQTSFLLCHTICLLFRLRPKWLIPLEIHYSSFLSYFLHKANLVFSLSICERMKILERNCLCCYI